MIICGDFAFPYDSAKEIKIQAAKEFMTSPKVVNFESSLLYGDELYSKEAIALYSKSSSIDLLNELGTSAVTLANNHCFDFNIDIDRVKAEMTPSFSVVGAGKNRQDAESPIKVGGFTIFNFGWSTIGVVPASSISAGCASLERKRLLRTLEEYTKNNSNEKVVVIFHWNYEFELLPLPVDRLLARELANAGVYAVIGHHSHIIQGYEYFGEMPVFYGIGNFFMPNYKFGNFQLSYPEIANTGICIDISDRAQIQVYKARNSNNNLEITGPYELENCNELFENSFKNLSDKDYIKFFKQNRTKSFLLPVYTKFGLQEKAFDSFVRARQFIIDSMLKLGIK